MLSINIDADWAALARNREQLESLPNRFVAAVLARSTAMLRQDAPADTGQLARSGRHQMTGHAAGEIIFDTNYSLFVHDGRGGGGINYLAIKDWVKSKGIDPKAAWPIAKSIAKKGTQAQPWTDDFIASARMRQVINAAMTREANHVA